MENKILEFVREFNAGLENSNYYNLLQYTTDGFNERIILPEIGIFSDNDSYDHFKTIALSTLTRQLIELLDVTKPLLDAEISLFFAEKKKLMKEKFPEANLKYFKEKPLEYSVKIYGLYNDELMEQFGEVIEEDFKYVFDGLKIIDIMYS